MKIINRFIRHKYHIVETFEAGVVFSGMEVKSVRSGRVDLSLGFVKIQNGEAILKNVYIPPYQDQYKKDYNPRKDRKLLLHKSQINHLLGKIASSAHLLIPLSFYTKNNMIKLELGLVTSKITYDHKKATKEKDELRKLKEDLKDSLAN